MPVPDQSTVGANAVEDTVAAAGHTDEGLLRIECGCLRCCYCSAPSAASGTGSESASASPATSGDIALPAIPAARSRLRRGIRILLSLRGLSTAVARQAANSSRAAAAPFVALLAISRQGLSELSVQEVRYRYRVRRADPVSVSHPSRPTFVVRALVSCVRNSPDKSV